MWTGKLFAKQVTVQPFILLNHILISIQLQEKFFKAFAEAHRPGHIAVLLVDNSQGHSSYAPDAPCAGAMNLKPGGKQARMCAGWFMKDGQKVIQSMIYGPDHEMYANQAKGMKAVLQEQGLQ
ncbi:hypothetical protein GYMLUDRAFT_63279 [Collybiopsis luxurians FD-317 M1]|uniref:Uncharacterized protein n=1 Tax=Collybiopsis luxurians FD-317 M1 TaxID=944289 RepID=A0A0D0BX53_9AGAR|nr:hypothetical protein GYMLUDRAFT_63279 [Collybiopsis luxurians FD-317 M1]